MAKEKSLVEEAIIQMKNLEEAVAENAKGILASTMSQEIKELVKESLTEQDDEIETDIDVEEPESDDIANITMGDDEEEEGDDTDIDNIDLGIGSDDEDDDEDEDDLEDVEDEEDDDEDTIDLTDVDDDEEILRVFQLMGPDDNIVVTKDDKGNTHLKDEETGKEYMIVGESEEEYGEMEFDKDDDDNESIEDPRAAQEPLTERSADMLKLNAFSVCRVCVADNNDLSDYAVFDFTEVRHCCLLCTV